MSICIGDGPCDCPRCNAWRRKAWRAADAALVEVARAALRLEPVGITAKPFVRLVSRRPTGVRRII